MRIFYKIGFISVLIITILTFFNYTSFFIGVVTPKQEISLNQTIRYVFLKQESNCTNQKSEIQPTKIDYLSKYPFLLNCRNTYSPWSPSQPDKELYNYSKPSPVELQDKRIIRGIVVHFPIDKQIEFEPELKWLYHSWSFIQTYEPSKWRTDLIIFTESKNEKFNDTNFFLNKLNCTIKNRRTNPNENPMCTIIDYTPIIKRQVKEPSKEYLGLKLEKRKLYDYFLKDLDIFSLNETDFIPLNNFLILKTNNYPNTDSVLVAFDGYAYFKSAGFDFLLRTDMDVFLTPLFAQWTPKHCNDFYTGGGGYSTEFNTNRFRRINKDLGLEYGSIGSIGSSWYSTPEQFRIASYLSVVAMGYLAFEEFSQMERENKLGTLLWPDWHYGVLSMYGSHMALNHLIAAKNTNLIILPSQIDFPSGNIESIFKMLHIHVFHGNLFIFKSKND